MRYFRQIGMMLTFVTLLPVLVACSSPAEPEVAGDTFIPAAQSDSQESASEPVQESEPITESEAAEPVAQESESYPAPDSRSVESDAYPAPNSGGEMASDAEAPLTFVIDPAASSVAYSVEEEFFNREVQFVTAVGTTSEIDGSIVLTLGETPAVAGGEISVDISTLQSDSARRDGAIRSDWLESDTYPVATFVPKAILGLSGSYAEGTDVSFQLVGDLTVREMTNEVTFDVLANLSGGTLNGTATTQVLMVDYGFEPPNIANILKVTDGVTLTIELVATQG